jgi:phenylpropionate dioxygenase-like ring-hydroxylating dioxygenase large terminal subunit
MTENFKPAQVKITSQRPSLSDRDGQLVENWYMACLLKEVPAKKPIVRTIYDQDIVLFFNAEGSVTAMVDRCTHRLARLSGGEVCKGHLVCPYHSWKYDKDGKVVEVPSEGPGVSKGHRVAKTFPTRVFDGAVWVWMGEKGKEDESKIWRFPEYGSKGWVSYTMITDFENEVTNLVENFMDVPHTVSVHKGWFRNQAIQKVPITTETKNGSVCVSYHQPDDNIGVFIKRLLNPRNRPMVHTDKFYFPNITRVDYSFGPQFQYIINSTCTPVSEMKTRVYTYIAYRIPVIGRYIKCFIQYYTRQVIEQDVWIMREQTDNYLQEIEKPRFQSTPADEPHLQIERLRSMGIKGEKDPFSIEKKVDCDIWI